MSNPAITEFGLHTGELQYGAVFRRTDDGATVEFPAFGSSPIPLMCGWTEVATMAHPAFEELLFLCWNWREEHDGELPPCDALPSARGKVKATATFRFRAEALEKAVTVKEIDLS